MLTLLTEHRTEELVSSLSLVLGLAVTVGVTVDVGKVACGAPKILLFLFGFVGHCYTEDPADQTPEALDETEIEEASYVDRAFVMSLSDEELRFPEQRQLLLDVIDGVLF